MGTNAKELDYAPKEDRRFEDFTRKDRRFKDFARKDSVEDQEEPYEDHSPVRYPAELVQAMVKLAKQRLEESSSESSQDRALDRMTWKKKRKRKVN